MEEYIERIMVTVCERCAVLEAYEDNDDALDTICRRCHAEAACRAVLCKSYADGFEAGRDNGIVHARREHERLVRQVQRRAEEAGE